jgi:uncharacterized membrane protein YvlD (DUF360 family)
LYQAEPVAIKAVVRLDDVRISVLTFGVAVVVFSAVSLVMRPLVEWLIVRFQPAAISLVALAATFLALVVTDALSDGLSVDGAGTWLSASVIVWVASSLRRSTARGTALRGGSPTGSFPGGSGWISSASRHEA